MSETPESICNDENINSNDSVSCCSMGHSSCNMQAKEVLEEFKKLYESRIKRIDQESPNSTELKVTVLEEWVQELYKQNAMLIDAAEELEREACERVALLESRMKCSARAARESTLRLQQFESQALEASAKRVKAETTSLKTKSELVFSEQEQIQLRKEVVGLQNDVAALLHLIRRAAKTGDWNTSGLMFFEVSREEVMSIIEDKEREAEINGELNSSISMDHSRKTSLLEQDVNKDSIIAGLESEVTRLSQELALCESAQEISRLGISINERNETVNQLQEQLQNCIQDNEKQSTIIAQLHEEVAEKRNLITKLRSNLTQMEKDAREARDVLTNEVAQKHDQVLQLRGENEKLEEDLHKACMQTRFKDDIIKEMRQEIRTARAKVAALEYHIECHNQECHHVKSCRYHTDKSNYQSPAEKHDLQSPPQKLSNTQEMHRHVNH